MSARWLTEWRFPAIGVAAARCNPPVSPLPEEAEELIVNLYAATYVVSCLGVGQGEDGYLYALDGELLAKWGAEAHVHRKRVARGVGALHAPAAGPVKYRGNQVVGGRGEEGGSG